MKNIYTNPDYFGLRQVGEIEGIGGYEFDTFVAWVDQSGRYFWAEDAGCSCPVPFEDKGLHNIAQGDATDLAIDIEAWVTGDSWNKEGRLNGLRQAKWAEKIFVEADRSLVDLIAKASFAIDL